MSALPPKNLADLPPEIRDYSNGPVLLAQTASIFAIAALVVSGRCYTRGFVIKSFGKDDWAMLAAMTFATVCFISYVIQISHGVGKHLAVIQADQHGYRQLLKARQVHMISVVAGISLVKISISFFLLRLATRKAYTWFLWGVIGFMAAFTLACMGTLIFQCVPVAATWDVRLRPPPLGTGNAKCFSNRTFRDIGLFNGVVNIITDFLLALLPVPLVWKLRMPLRTRITVVLILSLGLFAAVAGIIRQQATSQFRQPEPWIHDSYAIWNFVELDTGIIAASLPAIKPLFNWFFDAARSMTKGTRRMGYKSRNAHALSYQKQRDASDTDGFVMEVRKPGQSVQVPSRMESDKALWNIEQAEGSEEDILPYGHTEGNLGGIMVTKDVRVE